jgi:hypothetical protein
VAGAAGKAAKAMPTDKPRASMKANRTKLFHQLPDIGFLRIAIVLSLLPYFISSPYVASRSTISQMRRDIYVKVADDTVF